MAAPGSASPSRRRDNVAVVRTTRDGSPVDLYRLLPALGEPEQVHDAIAPGAEVLELGCGVGRITHPLVALGHRVVAVDESKEMLANVHQFDITAVNNAKYKQTFQHLIGA